MEFAGQSHTVQVPGPDWQSLGRMSHACVAARVAEVLDPEHGADAEGQVLPVERFADEIVGARGHGFLEHRADDATVTHRDDGGWYHAVPHGEG